MRQKPERSSETEKPVVGLPARLVATTLLTRVIDDHRNLDALCDRQHGIKSFLDLNAQDRGLARAICVTALRHRTQIEAALKKLMNRPPPKNARFLNHMLHVASAQILFMEAAESAAVNLAVHAIKNDKRTTRFSGLANAVLRRMAREKDSIGSAIADIPPFPSWFAKMLRTDYGKEKAGQIAAKQVHSSSLFISVKSEPQNWAKRLNGSVLANGSIKIESNTPVHELPGFDEGEWWVQDAAAALPAQLLKVPEAGSVLELCAAPGGKTAQLASAGYDVTAVDISEPRLKRLEENLNRLNLSASVVCADILEWEPECQYDAVLIDAPCSSTGTIIRHPDVLWTKQVSDIQALAELQFNLLKRAASMVKKGGCLVFANCSMLKLEGETVLRRAIDDLEGFEFSPIVPEEVGGISDLINGQGALRSLPIHSLDLTGHVKAELDGFFACRFTRV